VRIVQAYQGVVQGWLLAAADGQVPLGFRVQERIPMLRHLAARIFGLGVWPVRLSPVPTRSAIEVSPLPAQL
jgi:hypothetical protein